MALLTTKSDLTSNQVEAGVWTYLEISIGITCANLPLLLPLVRSWFGAGDGYRGYRAGVSGSTSGNKRSGSGAYTPHVIGSSPRSTPRKPSPYAGFMTLDDSPSGSDVELQNNRADERGEGHVEVEREKGRGQSSVSGGMFGDSNGAGSVQIYGLGLDMVDVNERGAQPVAHQPEGGIVVQTRVDVRYDQGERSGVEDGPSNVIVGGFGSDTVDYRTSSHGDTP